MHRYNKFLIALMLTITTGCSIFRPKPIDWSVAVVTPKHYDVWVESLLLETKEGELWRVPAGRSSCCWKEPENTIESAGRSIPNYMSIRWFSFAERKFYSRQIRLPDNLEQRMWRKTPILGEADQYERQNRLVIGLAPGGQIVAWIMNQPYNAEEVLRGTALEKWGSLDQYQARLESYEKRSGDYIRQHGIPHEGW